MPFALVTDGSAWVDFGAQPSINIPSSTPFKLSFKFRVTSTATEQTILSNIADPSSNFVIVSGSSKTLITRLSDATTILQTPVINIDTDYTVVIERTGTSALTVNLNGSQVATATNSSGLAFNRFMRRDTTYMSAGGMIHYFDVEINGVLEESFINNVDNTQTQWANTTNGTRPGVMNGFSTDGSQWLEYSAGGGLAWSTIDNQVATVGTPFNLDLSTFITGATSYASIGTALPAWASLNTSTGLISGTPDTVALTSGLQFSATDGVDTVNSNAFSIDAQAGATVPQGAVTIGTITVTATTANIPFSYDAADETGYEYRINGGAEQAVLSNPITVTALTPNTLYTVEVRAVNAQGAGTWSAASNFTTSATVTITTGAIKNESLTALADTLFATVDVYLPATGALVARYDNVTSSPTGVITIQDAVNFTSGVTYRLWYELPSGDWGTEKAVAV